MKNSRRRTAVFIVPMLVGLTAAFRVAPNIRTVDFLSIFGSGMVFGVGLMGIIQVLRNKTTA